MPDLKIDPTTGDLFITPDGKLALTNDVTGESLCQLIRIKLRMVLGEWFMDNTLGIDYFGQVFVKHPDLTKIQSMFKSVILSTPGVSGLIAYTQTLNTATRALTITATIKADTGNLVPIVVSF